MAPRPLINLVLLAVVLALAALAWLGAGGDAEPAHRLTELSPGDVQAISIERGADSSVVLEREGGGWILRQPYGLPADPQRVGRVLRMLGAESHRRLTPPAGQLEQYGLTDPLARLRVDGLTLEMGRTEPLRHRRYVRSGAEVHLIEDLWLPVLLGRPESFLDHRLLGGDPRITALEVRVPGGADFRIDRGSRGEWRIDPAGPPVSADRLTAWMDRWRHARAVEVLPAPEGEVRGRVSVGLEGVDGPVVFEILEESGRRLLVDRGRGLAYRIGADAGLLERPGD
jgi:hypothetical protein